MQSNVKRKKTSTNPIRNQRNRKSVPIRIVHCLAILIAQNSLRNRVDLYRDKIDLFSGSSMSPMRISETLSRAKLGIIIHYRVTIAYRSLLARFFFSH